MSADSAQSSSEMDGVNEKAVCSIDQDSQITGHVQMELKDQLSNNDIADATSDVQMQQIQSKESDGETILLSEMQCDDHSVTASATKTKVQDAADAVLKETLEAETSSELSVNTSFSITAKQQEDSQQNKCQRSTDLGPDSIMEVASEMMDITAEIVGDNEKIVVKTEKIEGSADERQHHTQKTNEEENSIMPCQNITGSDATCNKLNLLNLDANKITPDLTIVKQEPGSQEMNSNLVTFDKALNAPVERSTSNGDVDGHNTVLTTSKKSDALSSLTMYRTNVSDDDSAGDSGTADSDDDSSSESSSSSSSSSDSDDEASDSGNNARYVDL